MRRLAAERKQVLVLDWDNAAWHVSRRVRRWIEAHNQGIRRTGSRCRTRVDGRPVGPVLVVSQQVELAEPWQVCCREIRSRVMAGSTDFAVLALDRPIGVT